MLRLPDDPIAAHARLMAAICDDFASPEFLRTGKTPRANAVAHIARNQNGETDERARKAG